MRTRLILSCSHFVVCTYPHPCTHTHTHTHAQIYCMHMHIRVGPLCWPVMAATQWGVWRLSSFTSSTTWDAVITSSDSNSATSTSENPSPWKWVHVACVCTHTHWTTNTDSWISIYRTTIFLRCLFYRWCPYHWAIRQEQRPQQAYHDPSPPSHLTTLTLSQITATPNHSLEHAPSRLWEKKWPSLKEERICYKP